MLSQEKRDFLLEYPWIVSSYVSVYLPLTQEQLRKYYELFDWESIGCNEAIQWNTDIIDEFIDDLLPIITEDNDPGYEVYGINTNYSLPWSVELIERYMDRWNWDYIADNQILPKELRLHFAQHIMAVTDHDVYVEEFKYDEHADLRDLPEMVGWQIQSMREHPELCIQDPDETLVGEMDWNLLSSNEFLPWSEELIARFQDKWNWRRLSLNESIPWSQQLIGRFGYRLNWNALSRNAALPWSEEFIALYAPYWHYGTLSENEAVPWTLSLLKKYEAVLAWGVDREDENGEIQSPAASISSNYRFPWTVEIWDAFHDRLDGSNVVYSTAIHWDFETMKGYSKHWKPHNIFSNKEVFLTSFPELKEPETLFSLMDEILERYQRGDYKIEEGDE